MMGDPAETSNSSAPPAFGSTTAGPIATGAVPDLARRAVIGAIWDRMGGGQLLYILPIPDIIWTVGLTNEAETRRCAASPESYCLDRTPSFLAGTTVTFNQGPESKATGHTFHR